MKAKIFSFIRISDQSIVASVRVAKFIASTLNLPLCWDESIADERLDILLIIGGAYAFAKGDTLERLGKAIETAGTVIWVSQDYTVIPPKDISGAESPFRIAFRNRYEFTRQASVSFWTTVEPLSKPGVAPSGHLCGEYSTYINWNVLTMDESPPSFRPWAERTSGNCLLYYGSWRSGSGTKDRVKYFNRYFTKPSVPTVFSCPTNKPVEHFPLLMHETKLYDLQDYLSNHGLGLYLEDGMSHKEFHSPANRFYEMLSAGLPMVFQPEAQRMMEKAGYDISSYMMFTAEDGPALMERKQEILNQQRHDWMGKAVSDRKELPIKLLEAWRKL